MLDEQLAEVLQANAAKWAPGIEIISVRITKPTIPSELAQNYVRIESSKTALKIAEEEQRVKEQSKSFVSFLNLSLEAETERREARIKA